MSGLNFEAVKHGNADCSSVRAKNVHLHENRNRELNDDKRMIKHDADYLKRNIDKITNLRGRSRLQRCQAAACRTVADLRDSKAFDTTT